MLKDTDDLVRLVAALKDLGVAHVKVGDVEVTLFPHTGVVAAEPEPVRITTEDEDDRFWSVD